MMRIECMCVCVLYLCARNGEFAIKMHTFMHVQRAITLNPFRIWSNCVGEVIKKKENGLPAKKSNKSDRYFLFFS